MKFVSRRDYQTMIDINKELINDVIDVVVGIFKINLSDTKTNIYGEGNKKIYYSPVLVPCLINRQMTTPTLDGQRVSVAQQSSFAFLRKELEEKNIYPEPGDIVQFHNDYYEIITTNETQLIAGQTTYNHAIFCETVLTRQPKVTIDKPIR